jgi:tetratricopeptide (TPR) repeat protein
MSSVIEDLQQQIDGVKMALRQVNEGTKAILQQNLQNLETQLLEYATAKNNKENDLNTFVNSVIQLAEQLKQSETLNSERLQKARALFKEGKYQEINRVLYEADIDSEIAQFEKKGKILANELTIKAQATVLTKEKGWFREADRLYAKALSVVENYITTFNYAYFLAEHKQILRAVVLYKFSLKYISEDNQKAMTLNNLGALQKAKNEFEKAEKSYQEALEIRRKLAKVNPQTYLPDVGMTLNNLANLQKAKNEFEKAEKSYQEALEIVRKLAEVNPEVYSISYANKALNLAIFYLNSRLDKFKSVHYAREAIKWYKPFKNTVHHAEKYSKVAQEILDYWDGDTNDK